MAWVPARCRDGGETAFRAVRRSARGCVRRLSTRARSVCPSSGRGVAALFAYAQFLAAGFCESDPSRHAGAASPARGCSRPFLVSLDNARQFGSFRIWLGSRHRPELVATTRKPSTADAGDMFSGERAETVSYASITVSIPPDSARKIGRNFAVKLPCPVCEIRQFHREVRYERGWLVKPD
jgi:hypothetical protein